MSDRAPDLLGEIAAWRTWTFTDGHRIRLTSSHNTIWPADAWTFGECPRGRPARTGVPHDGHSCGIYAADTPMRLYELGYSGWRSSGYGAEFRIVGKVGLAGLIRPHSNGVYRAQKARPLQLYVPHDEWVLGRQLAQAYGIPVELANTFDLLFYEEATSGDR